MDREQYYEAKKEFYRLNAKDSRTQQETDRFYDLLREIHKYEIEQDETIN